MKLVTQFLRSLAHAITVRNLYDAQHPAVEEASREALESLASLLEEDPTPAFTFVEDRVVYGDRPLQEMEGWRRGRQLAAAGFGRLEFVKGVKEKEFQDFLDLAASRFRESDAGGGPDGGEERDPDRSLTDAADGSDFPHIRYGDVRVRLQEQGGVQGVDVRGLIRLLEEAQANRWIHEMARDRSEVPAGEARAVVRSLSVALHSERHPVVPIGALSDLDQYTTVHSMNVSLLSMALAEELDYTGEDVFQIGVGALLHDIGKSKTPLEILNKPGRLSDREMAAVQRHPVDGAEMIMRSSPELRLAAVITYEHHMQGGGGGYPERQHERERHPASRIVQVADVYDATRTDRPYRDALPPDRARDILRENAGDGSFDPEAVDAFLELIGRVELRADVVEPDDPQLPEEVEEGTAGQEESGSREKLERGSPAAAERAERPDAGEEARTPG